MLGAFAAGQLWVCLMVLRLGARFWELRLQPLSRLLVSRSLGDTLIVRWCTETGI
jgi:hypothetical protein